jgi:hypothetical protein
MAVSTQNIATKAAQIKLPFLTTIVAAVSSSKRKGGLIEKLHL